MYDVDLPACRGRQRRLIAELERLELEAALLTQAEHIQWMSGLRCGPLFQPVTALAVDGHVTLVVPERTLTGTHVAADDVVPYEAQWHSTLRNDQRQASCEVLLGRLRNRRQLRRIGVEFSGFCPHLAQQLAAEIVDIEPILYRLRRKKDPDELQLMKRAIDATRVMYAVARESIRPGINELELYSRLYAAAVTELGEPPTYFGQDFQCNSPGGPPRDRQAQQGELYILDLGAGFRGYFSDNARTFAVGGVPSDDQLRAWEQIQNVFTLVESTVRAGASCRQLFEQAQALLDQYLPGSFDHHLGHGVGLFPHEAPHLNPHWDDHFELGDVFTVEPGLYHPPLRQGMRLEQNYRVTRQGVELLTDFPLEL